VFSIKYKLNIVQQSNLWSNFCWDWILSVISRVEFLAI